jgi:hypothetical protein
MIVIVGHGPSILSGMGSVIDSHTVVRLKDGLIPKRHDPKHWGTRTDYLAARSGIYRKEGIPYWHFHDESAQGQKWLKYFATFKPKIWKPSIGLTAVFMAIDHLDAKEIALIGFDRILKQDDMHSAKWDRPGKPKHAWGHCQRAERECLDSLGITIIDLVKDGAIPRLGPDTRLGAVRGPDAGREHAAALPPGCGAGA